MERSGTRTPNEWSLYRRVGSPVRIRTIEPIARADGALTSDYRVRDEDRRGLSDADEIGLAVSGSVRVGRFTDASSGESRRILESVADRLATLEQAEVDRWSKAVRAIDPAAVPATPTPVTAPGERGRAPRTPSRT